MPVAGIARRGRAPGPDAKGAATEIAAPSYLAGRARHARTGGFVSALRRGVEPGLLSRLTTRRGVPVRRLLLLRARRRVETGLGLRRAGGQCQNCATKCGGQSERAFHNNSPCFEFNLSFRSNNPKTRPFTDPATDHKPAGHRKWRPCPCWARIIARSRRPPRPDTSADGSVARIPLGPPPPRHRASAGVRRH